LDLSTRKLKLVPSHKTGFELNLTPFAMLKHLVKPSRMEEKLHQYDRERDTHDRFLFYGGVESACLCGGLCVGPSTKGERVPISDEHDFMTPSVSVMTIPHEQEPRQDFNDRLRMILPFAPALTIFDRAQVLDVGSGDGRFEHTVGEVFPKVNVLSYDPDPMSASMLSGVKLHDIVAEFDVVVMNQVLHHMRRKHPDKFFDKLRNLLRPGGVLVVREDVVVGKNDDVTRAVAHRSTHEEEVAYLTENEIYAYARKARFRMVHDLNPTDFPVFRHNKFARVYYFVRDDTARLDDYCQTANRLVGRFRQLRAAVLDQKQLPTRVYEALQAAGSSHFIARALVDYSRSLYSPSARIELQEPFNLLRLGPERLLTLDNYRNAMLYIALDLVMVGQTISRASLLLRLGIRYGNVDKLQAREAIRELVLRDIFVPSSIGKRVFTLCPHMFSARVFQDYTPVLQPGGDPPATPLALSGDVESNPGPKKCRVSGAITAQRNGHAVLAIPISLIEQLIEEGVMLSTDVLTVKITVGDTVIIRSLASPPRQIQWKARPNIARKYVLDF